MTLGPVEAAARLTAAESAEAIRRAARTRAAEIAAQTRVDVAAIVAARRAAAERLADSEESERMADARGRARAMVLRAQSAVYAEARAATHAAACRLAGDPRLEALTRQLEAQARERLADHGPVRVLAGEGGFVARAGCRVIDYSLPVQVDRVFEAMAAELAGWWS